MAAPVPGSKKWSACGSTETSTSSPSATLVRGLKRPTSAAAFVGAPEANWLGAAVVADVLGQLAHFVGHGLTAVDREVDEHFGPERLA